MNLCIYHHNCADGFAAACVVNRALKGDVTFHPGVYNTPLPDSVDGATVYLVDFSYTLSVMRELVQRAAMVIIIDHHATAIRELNDLNHDKLVKYMDVAHSGAVLAWKFFFPDTPAPKILLHVEDRDLWRFWIPGTRHVQAALFSYHYDLDLWSRFIFSDTAYAVSLLESLLREGEVINRKHDKDVEELVGATARTMTIGGHVVRAANLPYTMASDAAAILAVGYPFGATYYDSSRSTRVFSLRSEKGPNFFDVEQVAFKYGGGGHQTSSGFQVAFDKLLELGLL